MIEKLFESSTYLPILEKSFTEVFTENRFLFDIKNNKFTKYFTYIVDNKPIAFINYYVMYERAELININVLEDYQNMGIASKLIEYMIDDCQNKKVDSITLEVRKDNIKAIYLYKKYGFKEIGIRKGYYQGIDGILMEKELM